MRCPRCASTKLRKIASDDTTISIVLRPLVIKIRCYWCGHVFHRPTVISDELQSEPKYRRSRRAA